ncbi:MAG: hypothetical protein Q9228_004276 [Teloschistes exilis]
MPNGRVYIVNSADLAASIQRNPLKISFWQVEAVFSGTLVGLSSAASKILAANVDSDNGHPSYLRDGVSNVHATLRPGEQLMDTTRIALELLAPTLEGLARKTTDPVDLQQWIAGALMTSVTGSVFGPQNPYRDPEVARSFWTFEENAAGLLSLPFPAITCAKSYAAREKVSAAFVDYYNSRGCDLASSWVQGAFKVSDGYQISNEDKARLDISNSHAILANTLPTAFWTVYHIFADATVLEEVRTAVMPLVTTKTTNGVVTHQFDFGRIRDVPILRSVMHEALRHYANGTGTRILMEDTLLNGRYLLKKNSFVFMPNRSYHFDASVWGPTVDAFDAQRFVNFKPPSASFRAFGGGVNTCPGRFFAMNEILAISALLVLRVDIKPVVEAWAHPGIDDSNMTLAVQPPKLKTLVNFSPRSGWTDGEWRFTH